MELYLGKAAHTEKREVSYVFFHLVCLSSQLGYFYFSLPSFYIK